MGLYLIKILFGALEVFGMITISSTLFRSPYTSYTKELIYIVTIVSTIQMILYDIIESYFIINEIVLIISVFLLCRLFLKSTYWHSFLISIIGYIFGAIFQSSLAVTYKMFDIAIVADAIYNPVIVCTNQFMQFIIFLVVAKLIRQHRLGFIFVYDKLNFRSNLKLPTLFLLFFFALFFVLFMLVLHMAVQKWDYFGYMLGVVFFLFPFMFWLIYIRSIKELHEYHEKINIPALFK